MRARACVRVCVHIVPSLLLTRYGEEAATTTEQGWLSFTTITIVYMCACIHLSEDMTYTPGICLLSSNERSVSVLSFNLHNI